MNIDFKSWSVHFNTCSLVSFHCDTFSIHFGIYPERDEVYKSTPDGRMKVVEYERWLWGRGTELYDFCLEYFGLGPFLKVCWLP